MAGFGYTDLSARNAAVFYAQDEYGIELRDAIVTGFEARGGRVLDQVPLILDPDGTTNDYSTLAAQSMLRGEPHVVFIAARPPEVAAVVNEMAKRSSARFVSADGGFDDEYILARIPVGEVEYYRVSLWHQSLTNENSLLLVERFRELLGRLPTDVEALTYDATALALHAIRMVGNDPSDIRDFLTGLGDVHPPFQGVSGSISYRRGDPRHELLMVDVAADTLVARSGG